MLIFTKEEIREPINADEDQIELSKDELMPLINTRIKLLTQSKVFERSNEPMKQQCRDARENFQCVTQLAKDKWIEKTAEKNISMRNAPKISWENIKTLTKRFKGYHQKSNHFKLKQS